MITAVLSDVRDALLTEIKVLASGFVASQENKVWVFDGKQEKSGVTERYQEYFYIKRSGDYSATAVKDSSCEVSYDVKTSADIIAVSSNIKSPDLLHYLLNALMRISVDGGNGIRRVKVRAKSMSDNDTDIYEKENGVMPKSRKYAAKITIDITYNYRDVCELDICCN